jgi:hypothetical protein
MFMAFAFDEGRIRRIKMSMLKYGNEMLVEANLK